METKITKRWKVKSKNKKYELTIKFLIEKKLIYFIDCTCGDFTFRRIKNIGEFADKKYFAEPCKHLKPVIEFYQKQGYSLKKPKPMDGTDKCTQRLRKLILERSNGLCEANCGQLGQQIHRKVRGINGGKYNLDNCVLLCNKCHKLVHSHEFQ